MKGALVPAVILPRFTSYLGGGSYATPPMPVEEFKEGTFTFWRGPLVGGATLNPFYAHLEVSHDATVWVQMSTITMVNTATQVSTPFPRRWFRVRTELAADANGVVGISLWMAGVLERTVK